MNDFDLERLGEVWREEPPAAEVEWMRRSALEVSRRARMAQRLEAVAALLVGGMAIAFVIVSPSIQTALAAGGAILVLLVTQARQRRLRALELRALTGSTEEMLDQAIARTQAMIKRNWFSLVGMGPATILGLALAHSARLNLAEGPLPEHLSRGRVTVAMALLLLGVAAYLAVIIRRDRAQLRRLNSHRESYRREDDGAETSSF
jgi:hypothetical protein